MAMALKALRAVMNIAAPPLDAGQGLARLADHHQELTDLLAAEPHPQPTAPAAAPARRAAAARPQQTAHSTTPTRGVR
ncbi:hypothetical protein P3T36_007241 [Kitasatospora sp. MAP12-15]|uniref:hypothetical protein n=1 Tax=Kitasatospora sp. MAP12-15 TaxID=3035097 RepID=UPI003D1DD536